MIRQVVVRVNGSVQCLIASSNLNCNYSRNYSLKSKTKIKSKDLESVVACSSLLQNKSELNHQVEINPKNSIPNYLNLEKKLTCTSSSVGNRKPSRRRASVENQTIPEEVHKWWQEAPRSTDDGIKWTFLEHKGPVFAQSYEPLPSGVNFKYRGKPLKLSTDAEEIAGFYSQLLEHECVTKDKFTSNFFTDWRSSMTESERELIKDLGKCDFSEIHEYYKERVEERKKRSSEEKLEIKKQNDILMKEYETCIVDGYKEKIANFKIELPGLFRGRGDHPKMGLLRKRVLPEDVIINCSQDSKIPIPPLGHQWKEVRHDNKVIWLACWMENVLRRCRYVILRPSAKLKAETDMLKYEKARELGRHIEIIRRNYKKDLEASEMKVRQFAVSLYFIDKLALRSGYKKYEDQVNTVGCCSLRVEHIKLDDRIDDLGNVVTFDFSGKDSIRYFNRVAVDKLVYDNLKLFMKDKGPGDDLFDKLSAAALNRRLNNLMDGLTVEVFRTYNASHTLQHQLDELTPKGENVKVEEKIWAYNRANRQVAVLCNHRNNIQKIRKQSIETLDRRISLKKEEINELLNKIQESSKEALTDNILTAHLRLQMQLDKLEFNKIAREEGEEIALKTSKSSYLDPRITVAWCKQYDVPVDKIYNKSQRKRFQWAIDLADDKFRFS